MSGVTDPAATGAIEPTAASISKTTTAPGSRLVIGAAQFGQRYGNRHHAEPPDDTEARRLLATARRAGVHDIDTARAYGDSEAVIGRVRSEVPDLRVVSKIRPLTDATKASAPHTVYSAIEESVAQSLAALGSSGVDTLLLHRSADLAAGSGAALAAVRDVVAGGSARRWGVSVSGPDGLREALRIPDLSYVQLPFNVLDRRWLSAPVQDALSARPDVAVTARSVLLQGLLGTEDLGRWPSIPGMDPGLITRQLAESAERLGRDGPTGLAIGYVLAQPWIMQIVVGVRHTSQLADVLRHIQQPPLTADEVSSIHHFIAPGSLDLVDPARWPRRKSEQA